MRLIKKIFFIVIFLFLLFNLNLVYAQGSYKLNMEVNELEGKDEIVVEIKFKEASEKILGMQGEITYDKDILELEEIKSGKEAWNVTAFNKENGIFMIEINDDEFFNQDKYFGAEDKVLDAIFKIKKRENTEVKISGVKVVNSQFETTNIDEENININFENNSFSPTILLVFGLIIVILVLTIIILKKKNNKNRQ